MRVLVSSDKSEIFDKMVTSISDTVIAGRYFASRCAAESSKRSYGIEDFESMQQSLDQDYPYTYYLMVYRNDGKNIYRPVYRGSQKNPRVIRIICVHDISLDKFDYFGFCGDNLELKKVLNNATVIWV